MSQLIVLEKNGKKKYEWNAEEQRSSEIAREIFERKLDEGYAAFKLFQAQTAQTSKLSSTTLMGEQLHEFDSKAETIQLTPPMVGG